ncbi:MAG: NfeD family protein [Burkholderiaceae bacterium]|nr:NfeD family protein [Burkholderiaceae bacterium]
MDWSAATLWWLAAGGLVVAELLSGSFYLLMLALGAASGALAAHAALGPNAQMLAAALVGGGAVAAWHRRRLSRPAAPASTNPDVNLDIGQTVQVTEWDGSGSARVHYRGSAWEARFAGSGAPTAGLHRIHAVDGNRLLLVPV